MLKLSSKGSSKMAKKEMTLERKNQAANNMVDLIMELEKKLVQSNEKKMDSEAVSKISKMLEEVYKIYETEETHD